MTKHTILIIDDDVDICTLLKHFLERKGFHVITAFNGKDGIKAVEKNQIDLVVTDFRLPDYDGFEIIEKVKALYENLPIIVITGYSDVNQAVKVIRQGAYEYVTKPISPEEILQLIDDALEVSPTKNTIKGQKENLTSMSSASTQVTDFLIGSSENSRKINEVIKLVAPTDMTVIILGETGTGKEVAARMIHNSSPRKDQPFVPVDCGALPQELAASELFGHVKGAFTGATSDKIGSFELANGGTLFLDEIGNLSYENQVKLLRVLQERVIRKVGSEKDQAIDVRILVATNNDLLKAIEQGRFRTDIYYRINEVKIHLLPLREKKEELDEFIDYFIEKANRDLKKSVVSLSSEARNKIHQYPWPGNLRELENAIKHALLFTDSNKITAVSLPEEVLHPSPTIMEKLNGFSQHSSTSYLLKEATEKAEKEVIIKALEAVRNNKSKAAELLGIDRKTLYNKLNLYGLDNAKEV